MMKLKTQLYALLLGITAALGGTSEAGSGPINNTVVQITPPLDTNNNPFLDRRNIRNVLSKNVSSNWAGATIINQENGVKSATATFTIPKNISLPPGYNSSKTYYFSAMIGIDGIEPCRTGSIQMGIDISLKEGDDAPWYEGWAEWHPGGLQYIPQLKIAQGDLITLNATRINHTAGIVYLKHEDTGEYLTLNLKQLAPGNALCGYSASWVVWDRFGEGYPLPYFDPIEFQNVGWRNKYGEWAAVGNATEISAQEVVNGPIVVDCVMSQPQGVNCTYGGPMDEDEFGPGEKNGGNDTRQA
ncbi:concanavalin A-like lectin/glucanase domain-containing protein [Podospora australis]|uniref:Concanavalin A-like lectin/glucanase domain-containing protein n=1 Tax=Podospora australis TaxID=1536484 RepID=A0AAN7AF69_9PEZI|nr:concanavalin A-like lectin/glucanase domain-containing protein [Podospora australis]